VINSDEIIVEFDESERSKLRDAIFESFKLFWDGSLSLHIGFHLASLTNKQFVEDL